MVCSTQKKVIRSFFNNKEVKLINDNILEPHITNKIKVLLKHKNYDGPQLIVGMTKKDIYIDNKLLQEKRKIFRKNDLLIYKPDIIVKEDLIQLLFFKYRHYYIRI